MKSNLHVMLFMSISPDFKVSSLIKSELIRLQNLILDNFPRYIYRDSKSNLSIESPNFDTRSISILNITLYKIIHQYLLSMSSSAKYWVQFPVNIRILNQTTYQKSIKSPFSPFHIHSDIWSGAPSNSYNYFIYVFANELSHKFSLGPCIPSSLEDYRGPYKPLQDKLKN